MNETFTRIDHSTGSVHAGYGDMHHHNYFYNSYTASPFGQQTAPRSPRRIADDQLRLLRQRFVDPEGMGEARRLLAERSTVILHGPSGSGRTAAARVLLYELHRDSGIFRELLPGDEGEATLTDPGLVGAGDRLLLDLAEADGAGWARNRRDLSALRKAVHEQQAHLVVVMPYDGTLESDLQFYRAKISHPPAQEVFRRHLRLHQIPHEEYLQSAPALADFLDEQPSIEEIADFADRVRRARAEHRTPDDFAGWCEQARDARKAWRQEVAGLVAEQPEASQRALLCTTAMLHGAHADVIHHSTELLLRTLKTPRSTLSSIEGKDLAERLKEISASAGRDGHVRFDQLDFDAAVRAHFWDHLPDLRRPLSTWALRTAELVDPHVTSDLRGELVQRLADQYLRTGKWRELANLAEEWAAADTTSRARPEAAVHALTCGLENKRYGGGFRQLIYTWCRDKQLSGELAYVLLRVCTDVIAPTHPDQAMVRLHHLARRERGATPALDALSDVVTTSSRLRRRMLARLTRHSSVPAADARLFLRICDPVPLTDPGGAPRALADEDYVQGCVTFGWREVFAQLPRSYWQPYAQRWLHTASDTGDHHDLLLDLLVDAAAGDGKRLATLYAVARSAEPTTSGGPARGVATTDRLLQKISAAQGLGPSAARSRPTPPRGTAP
ncbi:ATP-binding protein [Streptomyces sioyaensis]|uniref:ATP-binding protein n=1 Tax=Streptomyces sioyaensis TaxID=67364 RepID=A0A4Q1R0R8_9ACTN|nr:ATP-binding protein [Streptomyces sioyaensis]MBM4792339.1 ATP-binding protein [Streptomyces sioyaensis]RXS65248.1 ATP-binding protein [Streptomyces sioyaensis]